jgi:hypothetical protein
MEGNHAKSIGDEMRQLGAKLLADSGLMVDIQVHVGRLNLEAMRGAGLAIGGEASFDRADQRFTRVKGDSQGCAGLEKSGELSIGRG